MFTRRFLIDAVERAIRAAAWAFLGSTTVETFGTDLDTTWQTRASVAGAAALYSIVASIAGYARPRGDDTGSLLT